METKRIDWIDIVKGIGIVLVLICHVLPGDNYVNIFSYSFHLPLFFIIGGYTIKENNLEKSNVKNLVFKNIKNIILPYYFYTFFILLVEIAKNILQKDFTVQATSKLLLDWILLVGIKADWFLPALFFAKTIFELVYVFLVKKNNWLYVLLPIMAIAVMLIPAKYEAFHGIICGVIGAFFVSIGFYLKKLNITFKWQYMIPIAIAWGILTYINGKVSISVLLYGRNMLLFLLNGILGTSIIIFISQIMDKLNKVKDIFVYLGKNSLIIMIVHMEIIAVLKMVFERIGMINSKDWLLQLLLIVGTFVLSVMVCPIISRCYSFLFNNKQKAQGKIS